MHVLEGTAFVAVPEGTPGAVEGQRVEIGVFGALNDGVVKATFPCGSDRLAACQERKIEVGKLCHTIEIEVFNHIQKIKIVKYREFTYENREYQKNED